MVSASSVWHIFPLCFWHPGSAPLALTCLVSQVFPYANPASPCAFCYLNSGSLFKSPAFASLHTTHLWFCTLSPLETPKTRNISPACRPAPHPQITEMVGLPALVPSILQLSIHLTTTHLLQVALCFALAKHSPSFSSGFKAWDSQSSHTSQLFHRMLLGHGAMWQEQQINWSS